MPLLGDRLRAERERRGLSQQELADLCGVTMRSQRNYEKAERQPDAAYLAALAAAGMDMAYIVTGQRASGLPMPGDVVREMSLPGQALRESGVALGQVVGELKAAGAMPGQALESVADQPNPKTFSGLATAQIDPERLSRIVEMLETAARLAGRKWQIKKLVAVAAEVYNVLADEPALDEPKVERILKLVVNR